MSGDHRRTERRLKRIIDITVASVVLVLTAPVVAVAALLVLAQFGAPVFFRQERTGLHERTIRVFKLRTMSDDRDAAGDLLPDGVRCRGVGRILRRLSIDELPQMVNVLRGDLSLVGPRPLLLRYDPWYTPRERMRFAVPPGITGLAQVNGRNDLAWTDRLELDVRYVLDWSIWLDLRIIARTVGRVLGASGVAVDPSSQMLNLDEERRPTYVR
ncbi:sugar transferase [Micromonospora sp. NBS 11-29]|uniref:sugar transferase n=1 Tax=Micromonospora sp. NBS 11-29 TaxID=1960879 RepID=UPI000B788D44|nr:sugar transferase [Micromonospora sp. NBS 11-29]